MSDNQQRAAELLRATYESPVSGIAPVRDAIAAALDAAEARGRAEVVDELQTLAVRVRVDNERPDGSSPAIVDDFANLLERRAAVLLALTRADHGITS